LQSLLRCLGSSSREALKQFKTLATVLKVARQTPAQSRLSRYRVDLDARKRSSHIVEIGHTEDKFVFKVLNHSREAR
jgi:hypothetical protein